MFSGLFFIMIALLLINFAPENLIGGYSPLVAFGISLGGYAFCLVLIALQNWVGKNYLKRHNRLFTLVANIELIVFLLWYLYFIQGHRLLLMIPYLEGSQTIFSLVCILFYLGGLTFFYYLSSAKMLRRPEAARQLRILVPFLIPFIVFTAILDAAIHIPNPLQSLMAYGESWIIEMFLLAASVLFLGISMIFLPFFIQKIWRCTPLSDPVLLERLESLCSRAQFKHAGMKTWTVMNRVHTAAIVGIIPQFRYVMFTQKLLNYLTPEEVEAVLAHEIGHSKKKHMILYPFIITGMLVSAGIFSLFFSEGIVEFLILQHLVHPSLIWEYTLPLSTVVPYIMIVACYFRIVFGYFSRLFERQADLYIFQLGIAPVHLVRALDQVAVATGGTHRQPSWHHYSIQQRIDFLDYAAGHPNEIEKHHRWVFCSLWSYFFALFTASMLLISPVLPFFPFTQISGWVDQSSARFSDWLNQSLREEVPEQKKGVNHGSA